MRQRWSWIWLSVLCLGLAACGSDDTKPPVNQPGGSGGSDETGGSGGDDIGEGGSGGEEGPVDTRKPLITITEPVNTNIDSVSVRVRGNVTDNETVEIVRIRLRGEPVEIEYEPGQRVDFSFDMVMGEGRNEVYIEAEDAAGNVGTLQKVYWPLPPREVPSFEFIDVSPAFPNPGEPVTISWKVKAVPDADVRLTIGHGAQTRENMLGSRTVVLQEPNREIVRLSARNAEGSKDEVFYISMGGQLRIWPQDAVVPTGDRQKFTALNSVEAVSWTRDGAPMADGIFVADRAGTFEVVATSDEDPPRTARTEITVAHRAAPSLQFMGFGGQFHNDGSRAAVGQPVVGADGAIRFLSPDGLSIARWYEESPGWVLEPLPFRTAQWLVSPAGEQWLVGADSVARRMGSDSSFSRIVMPWDESGTSKSIRRALPDGSGGLWIATTQGTSSEFWRVAANGSTSRHGETVASEIFALASTADGGLWVVSADGGGSQTLFRYTPGPGFSEMGGLPFHTTHLTVLPSGELLATGQGMARFSAAEVWVDESAGLPICAGAGCGVGAPQVSAAGVLVPAMDGLYLRATDGALSPIGQPAPSLPFSVIGSEGVLTVGEGADGTLVVAAEYGVFRLETDATSWELLSVETLLPGAVIDALMVEADGNLLIAGGGPLQGIGANPPLVRVGDMGYERVMPAISLEHPIKAIDRDDEGIHYGATRSGVVFGWIEETNNWGVFPAGHGVGKTLALASTKDGVLFLSDGERNRVVRLGLQDDAWVPEPGLVCGASFAKDGSGNLWAADCGFMKQWKAEGIWQNESLGLPTKANGVVLGTSEVTADDQDSLWLATDDGIFRRHLTDSTWSRVGTGTPSLGAERVVAGGGRAFAIAGGKFYSLTAGNVWVALEPQPPVDTDSLTMAIHPEGGLVLSSEGMGLVVEVQ